MLFLLSAVAGTVGDMVPFSYWKASDDFFKTRHATLREFCDPGDFALLIGVFLHGLHL